MSKPAACIAWGAPIRANEAALYSHTADGASFQVHIRCLCEETQAFKSSS